MYGEEIGSPGIVNQIVNVGESSNLCHTWFEAAARLPIRVIQACPAGYHIALERLAALR